MSGAQILKQFLSNRYVLFIGFLLLDTWIMSLVGGMPPLLRAWRSEVPLLLYLYFYLNILTFPSKWRSFITASLLVLAYAVFDIYFLQLGRLLRIVEMRELPELLTVIPTWTIILLVVVFGLPLAACLRLVRFKKLTETVLGAVPLVIIILMVEVAPDYFINAFQKALRPVTSWSDIQSAEDIGRIWMMLYHEAKRKSNIRKISNYRDAPLFLKEMEEIVSMLRSPEKKNNVHLIMLESFLDPTLFQEASFSRKPIHPEFEKLVDNRGSISIAPVFGGGTAQAEFEVLCGVPAMRKMSGVEFDVFTGQETYCLPAILAKGGYYPIATNAYKADFFNSINAYKSVGFKKSYYPKEYAKGRETYLSTGDVTGEKYMFDGNLFKQNLAFVTEWIESNPGVPLFNYVMTIYGHLPHSINTDKRPLMIDVTGAVEDRQLERSVNQYYYRTEAVAEFLNGIRAVDPESLVILISDHIPPVYGPKTYEKLGYAGGDKDFMHINRVFFFENGRVVHYETIHHYDIPDLILNYITGGTYCRDHACNFSPSSKPTVKKDYGAAYMTIVASGMK